MRISGIILIALACQAMAAPVPLEWQQPRYVVGDPKVLPWVMADCLKTHVFIKDPATLTYKFLGESTGTTLTVDLPPGTHILVASAEAGKDTWWAFSDPLTVEVPAPDWTYQNGILTVNRPCRIRVSPEFSGALDRWRSFDSPETPFTRVKIETFVSP